ncbi:hypothetical protein D3C77_205350 [compost metagenome]
MKKRRSSLAPHSLVAGSRPRPAFGKERGAQPGHKGQRREPHPHYARLCVPSHYPAPVCPCCRSRVLVDDKAYRAHPVFDLPELSYFVTEHRLFRAISTQCTNMVEVTVASREPWGGVTSWATVSPTDFVVGGNSQTTRALSSGRRVVVLACIEKMDYPIPVDQPLPVNGYLCWAAHLSSARGSMGGPVQIRGGAERGKVLWHCPCTRAALPPPGRIRRAGCATQA